MESGSFLSCAATVEWMTPQGSISRKVNYRTANLRLIRNEFREMFMEISSEKHAAIRLALKGINVFKKFMAEGKASVKFQDASCTLFISNAPPTNLVTFLRTIFVKMTGDKDQGVQKSSSQSMRAKLLSGKSQGFEEISPVTVSDLNNAKSKITKSTITTPSPPSKKRKCEDPGRGPVPKKLYSLSPLTNTSSLNAEQQRVLEACLGGKNIFFTGSAGTGKSFLLKRIVTALPPDITVATASTGVAACHIGGTTLHAFAGIGDGNGSVEHLCERVTKLPLVAQKWRKCKHLIIDEISMVDGTFFEVLCALSFFATGSYQRIVGLTQHMIQRTASRCIREVVKALNHPRIVNKWINFPRTLEQRTRNKIEFQRRFGLPGVIGCIDCTHIALVRPNDEEHLFYNRKGYHSINVQMICDSDLRILGVNAKFGGATHDSFIWSSSLAEPYMRELHSHGEQVWLLGDSGYPQRPWLMTPILNAAHGSREELYTQRHVRARNCIERCFGLLKSRWRCLLKHRTLHYHPHVASQITVACCILHNIALNARLPPPPNATVHDDGNVEDTSNDINIGSQSELMQGRALLNVLISRL